MIHFRVILLFSFFILLSYPFSTPQEYDQDIFSKEEIKSDIKDKDKVILENLKKLSLSFNFINEFYTSDNLDMQELDETSDQSIIDTDDKVTFAYSRFKTLLGYQVYKDMKFNLGLSIQGLWGNDQIGTSDEYGGIFYFTALNVDYNALNWDNLKLTFHLGRQPFSIGGVPYDYLLKDILDCAVVELKLADYFGSFRILAFDFYSGGKKTDDVNFSQYIGETGESIRGMRGDTNIFRYGAIYENSNLIENLTAKAFFFYADIGGVGTGADVTFNGTLGNFPDNDWSIMWGFRGSYNLKFSNDFNLLLFGEWAYSQGIDRQEYLIRDIKIKAYEFSGGLQMNYNYSSVFQFQGLLQHFIARGPYYASDGQQFLHGFVSFKGDQIGGVNLNQFAGWHPTAYIGTYGIHETPQDIERVSATNFIHLNLGFTFYKNTTFEFDGWALRDNGFSYLNTKDLESGKVVPPYGYSTDEYLAQDRLGKYLGTEIDFKLQQQINDPFSVYTLLGIFFPGDYYKIKIDKVAGSALGGDATFWVFSLGTSLKF